MLYLRFTSIKPALYSVLDASSKQIAEVKIQPAGPPTVTPARRLSLAERRSIAAFAKMNTC
jgi:hypothetical protein